MKYLFLVLLGLIVVMDVEAQDLQSFFNTDSRQHSWTDPSYVKRDTGITIVLPGFDFRFHNSGPSLNDILVDGGDGVYQLQLAEQLDNFEEEEFFGGEFSIPALGLDWRIGNQMISIGYQINMQSVLTYKKDLIELYQLGNAPFIGETLDLGPDFLANAYQEIYVGYAKSFSMINLGARVKFITGMSDLSTSSSKIELYTDPDIYQLTTTTDYVVNGSGALEYNSLEDLGVSTEPFQLDAFGRNMGWAVDLAISGTIGDKLSYGISALDLGSITWDLNTNNITSQGEQSFEGINVVALLNDKNDIVIEDSIQQLLEFEKTRLDYSNALFSKYYVRAAYQLSNAYNIGVLFTAHQAKDQMTTGYGINNSIRMGSALGLNAMIGMYDMNPFLGLGVQYSIGPMQMGLGIDNALAFFNGGNYNSGRFGWSISF